MSKFGIKKNEDEVTVDTLKMYFSQLRVILLHKS